MNKNIWATFFHKISTNDAPQHGMCPAGANSWCGFNKAKAENKTYEHKDSLPYDVMVEIKSIYRALTQTELLHGHTQNPNESFNNVWAKIPMRVFVRLDTLRLGIYDAVLSFNEGHSSKLDIYKKLGLSLCAKSVDALQEMDIVRQRKSDKAAERITKEARQARRKRRLMQEEDEEIADDPQYGAGLF